MPATRETLIHDLKCLGVQPDELLMVHASVRSLGPVTGGVNVIVQALFEAVGTTGTLCA